MTAPQATVDYERFCPSEEQIKISNAICRGRRRSNYPSCQDCQFNDDRLDLASDAEVAEGTDTASDVESVFHFNEACATVPVPLSQDAAWRIGHAAAQYLRGKLSAYDRADPNTRSLVVGRDMRAHSADLQQSLIEGVRSTGLAVIDVGAVDTPQFYFAVNHTGACGGIQITGGSMPADYNGFIICGARAVPVTTETGLTSIRDIAVRVPKHKTGTAARLTDRDLSQPYADFVRGFLLGHGALARRMKVFADAGNGMAGRWLPVVFDGIENLTVIRMNFKHDGRFSHDPDPMDPKNTRQLRASVKKRKVALGVCFSGDAASCAFVDERGTTIRSDLIAAAMARMFIERNPGAAVVLDLRSTRAAVEEIQRAGGVHVPARVGPVFIKKAMADRNAVFGADLQGRFYFRENFFCESAILACVHVLNLLTDTDRKFSEVIRSVNRYRSSGELRFPCPDPDGTVQEIADAHAAAQTDALDGITARYPEWSFNVRRSPTESAVLVTLEARSKKAVVERLAELRPLLGEPA